MIISYIIFKNLIPVGKIIEVRFISYCVMKENLHELQNRQKNKNCLYYWSRQSGQADDEETVSLRHDLHETQFLPRNT